MLRVVPARRPLRPRRCRNDATVPGASIWITRSRSPEHLAANLEVFDFELTDDQMAALNGLDDGTRYRPDPETYTG